ncbi:MAG TPA: glycosyltransferase family 1 protein [Candidatus Wolfebacteria bacterium]|nr:glycosyltransferase family 1 protein [Candidatus Wolfebacteria bacterium]
MKYKLAILTSHPIQYQVPLFKKIAEHPKINLTVYFYRDIGIKGAQFDSEFGKKIRWDIPLLEGYNYIFLKNSFDVIGKLKKQDYDAILVHGWNYFSSWLAFIAAFIAKTPVFLHGENPLNQEVLKSGFKRKIKKVILGRLFKRISAFLYIGEENKKFYEYYGVPEKKLFFAPYAVDNSRFIAASKELRIKNYELREKLGIKKDDVVILFTGKFIEKKRPMDLLKAYKKLKNLKTEKLKNEITLVFVGSGQLEKHLRKYVKENNLQDIHFIGFKNQTELPEYYAMADIFVLPSGSGETWGLVVNEAMCFGLSIITSDLVGCAADLVKSGENGYDFPVGDIDKLSEYLKELINNSKKRELFGKKSLEIVKNYSYENDIESILEALKQ